MFTLTRSKQGLDGKNRLAQTCLFVLNIFKKLKTVNPPNKHYAMHLKIFE